MARASDLGNRGTFLTYLVAPERPSTGEREKIGLSFWPARFALEELLLVVLPGSLSKFE